jgi:hypothetical protein
MDDADELDNGRFTAQASREGLSVAAVLRNLDAEGAATCFCSSHGKVSDPGVRT